MVRRVRTRIKTCSLRTAIARWVVRRVVPAVFPKMNPLARALLRSPLHGLMSRHVIVLCFEGRRTGKRYETPIAYRRSDDGALEALTSVHGAWWRNLESGELTTVVHCGLTVPARVDVVLGCDSTQAEAVSRALASRDLPRRAMMPVPPAETVLLRIWPSPGADRSHGHLPPAGPTG